MIDTLSSPPIDKPKQDSGLLAIGTPHPDAKKRRANWPQSCGGYRTSE
jgi:hypothetical protein